MEYRAFLSPGTRARRLLGQDVCWKSLALAQQVAITDYAAQVLTGAIDPDPGADVLVIYGYEDPGDDNEVGFRVSRFDPATCEWVHK